MLTAGLILAALIVGVFLGHWAGYTRAEDVGRRRLAHTLASGPQYRRKGGPTSAEVERLERLEQASLGM